MKIAKNDPVGLIVLSDGTTLITKKINNGRYRELMEMMIGFS